jgi:hypothetical protein
LGSSAPLSPTAHTAHIDAGAEVAPDTTVTSQRDFYHAYLIRSINEGFADLWGWLYSGNPSFLLQSIATATERSLNQPGVHFMENDVRARANSSTGIDGGVYLIGTSVARRLYATYQSEKSQGRDEQQLRVEMAQALLRSVAALREKYQTLGATEYLDPDEVLRIFNEQTEAFKWVSQVGL